MCMQPCRPPGRRDSFPWMLGFFWDWISFSDLCAHADMFAMDMEGKKERAQRMMPKREEEVPYWEKPAWLVQLSAIPMRFPNIDSPIHDTTQAGTGQQKVSFEGVGLPTLCVGVCCPRGVLSGCS